MPVPLAYAEVRIPFKYLGASPYGVITHGVKIDGVFGGPTELAEAVMDDFEATIIGQVDASIICGPVQVSIGESGGDNSGEGTTTATGSRTASSLPPNCALLVDKLTGTGGRRGRGRMFVPWMLDDTDVDETGLIGPSTVTSLQTAWSAYRTALDASSLPMVLFHSNLGTPSVVTSLAVRNRVATMGRRMRR